MAYLWHQDSLPGLFVSPTSHLVVLQATAQLLPEDNSKRKHQMWECDKELSSRDSSRLRKRHHVTFTRLSDASPSNKWTWNCLEALEFSAKKMNKLFMIYFANRKLSNNCRGLVGYASTASTVQATVFQTWYAWVLPSLSCKLLLQPERKVLKKLNTVGRCKL